MPGTSRDYVVICRDCRTEKQVSQAEVLGTMFVWECAECGSHVQPAVRLAPSRQQT